MKKEIEETRANLEQLIQMEIKAKLTEINNSAKSVTHKRDQAKDRISDLQDKLIEEDHSIEEAEKTKKKVKERYSLTKVN